MNNKLGGWMILGGITGVCFLLYWYIFIHSLVHLTFTSNVPGFSIELQTLQKKHTLFCETLSCELPDIAALNYTATFIKDGYKTISYSFKPNSQNTQQQLVFQKDYKLIINDSLSHKEASNILKATTAQQTESSQEKIVRLSEERKIYLKIPTLQNEYIFKRNNQGLSLYEGIKFLGNFPFVGKSEIQLQEIVGNNHYLFLQMGKQKFLFSKKSGKIIDVIFAMEPKYIKSMDTNGTFVFVTDEGSFLYDMYSNSFSYNTFFDDFIYFDKDSYIGLIHKNSKEKMMLGKHQQYYQKSHILVQYFPKEKKSELLLETQKEIIKIWKQSGEIFLEDNKNIQYQLSHFQE